MSGAERIRRDEAAARRLARGESWEAVAARYRLSRVQLWRRIRQLDRPATPMPLATAAR